jgi:hypothetical protein
LFDKLEGKMQSNTTKAQRAQSHKDFVRRQALATKRMHDRQKAEKLGEQERKKTDVTEERTFKQMDDIREQIQRLRDKHQRQVEHDMRTVDQIGDNQGELTQNQLAAAQRLWQLQQLRMQQQQVNNVMVGVN